MELYIRQRIFSWTDSYDVCDETGEPRYEVRGELFSLGHRIHVYEKHTGREVGAIHEKLLTLLPRFEIAVEGRILGSVCREFSFFRPRYQVDYLGWQVEGDLMGWEYTVCQQQRQVMSISKKLWQWSDTYVLRFDSPDDEITGLLLVLAIDAAGCSHND